MSGGSEDEEEMEQDGMDMRADVINDDSFSEDDGGLNKEDEYPGNRILKDFWFFNTSELSRLILNNLNISVQICRRKSQLVLLLRE